MPPVEAEYARLWLAMPKVVLSLGKRLVSALFDHSLA
ncbi:hypothetical protein KIPE111705_46330 [Kibdelosporangium persicum]